MTTHLEIIAAGVSAIASAILGSKVAVALGEIATNQLPDWMQWLLGPLGALVGMLLAITWLSKRLDKAELKADTRELERDADRKTLISALAENSAVIREVKDVIGKCKGRASHESDQ